MNRRSLPLFILLFGLSLGTLAGLATPLPVFQDNVLRSSSQVAYHRRPRCRARRQGGFQGTGQLPRGRRTWQGRYFGNFNNRYYGPQYGYF